MNESSDEESVEKGKPVAPKLVKLPQTTRTAIPFNRNAAQKVYRSHRTNSSSVTKGLESSLIS